jgi:ubiquinone/menaquinone biosynthesis C-methylase UbiE
VRNESRYDLSAIAEAFDGRAARYASSDWHKRAAERLVALCALRRGDRVLDAATGTGFAALAAAQIVGLEGRITGLDVSPGMLREARAAIRRAGVTNVELIESDAANLPQYGAASFHAVTCAAGLLYMPVADALREWHRVLKPGGIVAFSSMCAGSPLAGRIFRDCAAAFGIVLRDPCEPLGSASACRNALETAGFEVADIVSEAIEFSAYDLTLAWESNSRSAAHGAVRLLSDEQQRALKEAYLEALDREARTNPGALERAQILYALGRVRLAERGLSSPLGNS